MSIIYHIVGKPLPGKQKSMLSQFRTGAGIMSRLGSLETRVSNIVMGNAAGNIGLACKFNNFSSAMRALADRESDPHWQELMETMGSNISMELQSRGLLRLASGELDLSAKVHHIRTYSMKRDHLPQALEMFKELEEIKDANTKVAAIVPSVSADMSVLHALYQNNSLEEAGNAMDEVGMSEAFQKLVIRASQLGTLEKSTISTIA
tara:strand:- start:439 stop:1056 length:618 start_codon:yes stop_codon:yes gene_type:complete